MSFRKAAITAGQRLGERRGDEAELRSEANVGRDEEVTEYNGALDHSLTREQRKRMMKGDPQEGSRRNGRWNPDY